MPDDLAYARARAARVLADHMQAAADRITGVVCPAEMASWPAKEIAARTFDAGTLSPEDAAMLDDEAGRKGITRAEVARAIHRSRLVFRRVASVLTEARAKLDGTLAPLATEAAIEGALAQARTDFDGKLGAALTAAQADLVARGLVP